MTCVNDRWCDDRVGTVVICHRSRRVESLISVYGWLSGLDFYGLSFDSSLASLQIEQNVDSGGYRTSPVM